ncbi:S41 family peptidase [Mucilaginibacter ginkgonis]|uniref:S41 family peptidase n=1 Tax=Mucilaginibacter ginkgonis TaxID=2682091 RepID=A0A6I4INY3_9SPHI|nr:S41 family peptidase [Mucilaginibacter ginkgonis]QQL49033.1 S41 family peptidase [Mucilaginibacter ginkgonis]
MKHAASVIFRSLIILLAGVAIGLMINGRGIVARQVAGSHKIDSALLIIKKHYVDKVNGDTIEADAITNILQSLDPHSVYLRRQQAMAVNERLEGHFNGIGIEYLLMRDTMFITQVYAKSPAAVAGIKNGDRVLTINYKKASGAKATTAIINALLRKNAGNKVEMTVMHLADNKPGQHFIARGVVPLSSLEAAYLLNKTTAYVKFSRFANTTDSDFRAFVLPLKKLGAKNLVLDLRGNRGGYLDAATSLADEFLPKDELIVYTKGEHEKRANYFSTDAGIFKTGKIAVLIDEYSASSSEIVAGALQDLDRAIIIGRRSFGKGLVQQQFPFADGSAMNLTVARYYTPSGRSIQKSYKDGADDYRDEIKQRREKGEMTSADSSLADTSLKKHAYYTLSGKKVFGGGGITPDIFVPQDTAIYTKLLGELAHAQLFTAYTIDKQQPILARYDDLPAYIDKYIVTDGRVDDFILYASRTLKEMDSREIRIARLYIKLYLKAFAARFKWGDAAYFKVLNHNDTAIQRALAVTGK